MMAERSVLLTPSSLVGDPVEWRALRSAPALVSSQCSGRGTFVAQHRQRLCRICHRDPVWTHGDVKDNQGTRKRCHHKHVWGGNTRSMHAQKQAGTDGFDHGLFGGIGEAAGID